MKLVLFSLVGAVAMGGLALADGAKVTTPSNPSSAVMLSDAQMDQIVGGNHVIRLVLQQTGKDAMPTEAARAATDRAGSIDGAGKDRPAIVRRLN